ncbi:MAG: UDP-glucose 4-epimerase GalE [Candidatus Babeliaceae bacterium]|jgi:UDP-glucose 4-epimerase
MKTVLVTGGAGYIGSAISLMLVQHGYRVIIIDHAPQVPDVLVHEQVIFYSADFADTQLLNTLFTQFIITAVIHCAAYIEVAESVAHPQKYYNNNVTKTITLLDTIIQHRPVPVIFSSSAAVYGTPLSLPIPETHPKNPISPYGMSKYIVECILHDYNRAYGLPYVVFRYFNAAGALPEYKLGERHTPETHIIPLLIRAASTQKPFTIFGNYTTPDGSAIRDYIHVADIASAHIQALTYILTTKISHIFNLGTGDGNSILEVIAEVNRLTKHPIISQTAPARAGDPAALVADIRSAQSILGWNPHYQLQNIAKSAYIFYINYCN